MKIFLSHFAKNQNKHHLYQPVKIRECGNTHQKESLILLCLIFLPVGMSLWPFLYLTFVYLNNIYMHVVTKGILGKKRCSPPPQIVPASDAHQQPLPKTIAKDLADVRNGVWLTWSQIVGSASTPFLLPLSCPQNPSSLSGSRFPQG